MLYKRRILNQINKHIKDKEIIVLTGMRRVGKTTLYQMIFKKLESKNKFFLDMENPIEQKVFEEKDYNNIMANLKEFGLKTETRAYIFLDEVQAMPQAIKAVKYIYDHYKVKFFLTGSSSFYLKNLFPESLAGRKFVFELFPLDFEEFLVFKNVSPPVNKSFAKKDRTKSLIRHEKHKKYYDEYMEHGGFPEVVLSKDAETKKLRLNDIFKSYFEKDVRALADFREMKAFRDLILLLMQRVGSKIEITKLASEIGVSRETIYSFLSFLESTYFVSFISPFTRSVDREISGGRKVYLCDNGLLNHFAKVSLGSLFENSVFLNLRKYGKLNYYQRRSGGEIDFILKKNIALEIKLKGLSSDFKKLEKISQSLSLKQCYVITKNFVKENGFIPVLEI